MALAISGPLNIPQVIFGSVFCVDRGSSDVPVMAGVASRATLVDVP